jgi:hypothetical protein
MTSLGSCCSSTTRTEKTLCRLSLLWAPPTACWENVQQADVYFNIGVRKNVHNLDVNINKCDRQLRRVAAPTSYQKNIKLNRNLDSTATYPLSHSPF